MEGQIAVRDGILSAVRLDPRKGLDALVAVLAADGFRVVGPVVRGAVIAYDDVVAGDDLPTGWAVEQAPGRWRADAPDGRRYPFRLCISCATHLLDLRIVRS